MNISTLARPVAFLAKGYIVHSPVAQGKGVIVRRIAPLLPLRYREFVARLTGGGAVVLRFDEWVGRHYLQHGSSFDPAELEFSRAQPRSMWARTSASTQLRPA